MSLTVTDIPAIVRSQLYETAGFRAMCMSSWRDSAYTTNWGVRRTYREFKSSADQTVRAYLGWDIITTAVEQIEIVATFIMSARQPQRFGVHQASTEQIEALFTELRDHGVEAEELRSMLGITGPRGLDARAVRTLHVVEAVVDRIRGILQDMAGFWIEQLDHARWFRHFPAALTPEETCLIDIENAAHVRARTAAMAMLPGAVAVVSVMQTGGFEHTVLLERMVLGAAWLSEAAADIVMTAHLNSGINPNAARKTTLYPRFLDRLSDEERHLLFTNGAYVEPV